MGFPDVNVAYSDLLHTYFFISDLLNTYFFYFRFAPYIFAPNFQLAPNLTLIVPNIYKIAPGKFKVSPIFVH